MLKLGKIDRKCEKCEKSEECYGDDCKYKEKNRFELNFDKEEK